MLNFLVLFALASAQDACDDAALLQTGHLATAPAATAPSGLELLLQSVDSRHSAQNSEETSSNEASIL